MKMKAQITITFADVESDVKWSATLPDGECERYDVDLIGAPGCYTMNNSVDMAPGLSMLLERSRVIGVAMDILKNEDKDKGNGKHL